MLARGLLSFHPACPELGRRAHLPDSPEDSANSNYSRTYKPFPCKSNYSHTYATPGGGGCLPFATSWKGNASLPPACPERSRRVTSPQVLSLRLLRKNRGVGPSGHTNCTQAHRLCSNSLPPVTSHRSPVTRHWSLATLRHQSPVTNHQSLFTGHWPLVASH